MGQYVHGILGPFNGKIGTVIGSSWNGISYMRSLPRPSSVPPTVAQLTQRLKFGLATNFLAPLKSLLDVGYKSFAIRQTAYNAATAQLIADGLTGAYPNYAVDFSKVLFSKGNLTGAWTPAAASTVAGTIDVSWENNSGLGNAVAGDKVIILAYHPQLFQFVYKLEGALRSAATDELAVPAGFSGDSVHVWVAFQSADKKTISTSVYAGFIPVA